MARNRRILSIALILLLATVVMCPAALAFEIRGGGDHVSVPAGSVVSDDLYAAAQTITIDGTVNGDVVIAGQTITVNGTIEGNLIAAAQSIVINGSVRDNARLAAQTILVDDHGQIGKDLIVFGYSVETRPGSSVARDLGTGAYQALLAGTVDRNLLGGAPALELRGTVGGDAQLSVADSADNGAAVRAPFAPSPAIGIPFVKPGLTVTDSARINGKLTYTAAREFPVSGQVGQVVWNERPVAPVSPERPASSPILDYLRNFGAFLVVGLLLFWAVPGWARKVTDTIQRQPLPSFGWGLVAMMAIFGAALGICVATGVLAAAFGATTLFSLMGLAIVLGLLGEATLITSAIAFTALAAQALLGYVGGHLILERVRPEWATSRVITLLVGLVIFVALQAIPVVGWLIGFAAAALGLGAFWIWARDIFRPRPESVAIAPSQPGPPEAKAA